MAFSKPPQGDEESPSLSGFEVVPCDALTRLSESVVKGAECRSRLTLSRISIHISASLLSRREIKILPSLSTKTPVKICAPRVLSIALNVSFHNCR